MIFRGIKHLYKYIHLAKINIYYTYRFAFGQQGIRIFYFISNCSTFELHSRETALVLAFKLNCTIPSSQQSIARTLHTSSMTGIVTVATSSSSPSSYHIINIVPSLSLFLSVSLSKTCHQIQIHS